MNYVLRRAFLYPAALAAITSVVLLNLVPPALGALPLQPEQIVVTCFSGTVNYYASPPTSIPNLNTNGYVVAVFDTTTGNIGPLIPPTTSGPELWDGWDTPPVASFHNETGQPWNSQRLGEVFGICVDDATPPNIYVTATECYNIVGSATPHPKGAGGPGGVYKLDGTTGASTFGSLPNNSVNGPGLGNVCFRRAGSGTGYLYISDLEDGKIYRMSAATLAQAGSPFDHGVQARPNLSLAQIVDDGTPGLTQFGRRIWGVQTHQNRLYYGVWWEDSRNVSLTESNEIWSVNLDNNGDFIPATAQRLFALPDYGTYPWSHPAASIDFSQGGKMFLAERYWQYLGMVSGPTFGAHHTRILRYWLSGTNWVTDPSPTHQIGGNPAPYFPVTVPGANSAGGVAVNCDESVWGTGDMYAGSYSTPPNIPFGPGDLGYVYGCLRIPTGGNSMYAGYGYGSFAIDFDGNTNSIAKFGVGAIATVRECCVPPPTGLAAWWPLDELTGATTYADLSGNGNTAFIESGGPLGSFQSPSATPGVVLGGSQFIDSASRGRAPDTASLNFGTNSFSLDCWVRPVDQSPANSWQAIVDKLDLPSLRGYSIGLTNGNLAVILGDGALSTHLGPPVNYFNWNFVGVVVNRAANNVRFYVNGTGSGPQTLSVAGSLTSTNDLLIGAPYTPNIISETSLDEIELFNRALTTNELAALWSAGPLGKCKSGQPPCTNSVVTIVCPTNMTVACAPIVYYPSPQAFTTCGTITNLTCTPPSGSNFPVGPTLVTCTAYDSLGNSNSCSFTITVTPDVTPPFLDCACVSNSFHEQLNIVGCEGVVPSLCLYGQCFTDDCGLADCSQTPPAGTPVGPGVTPITFTVWDFAGNSNSCTVVMTVTPPPGGCDGPCDLVWNFLDLAITSTNGIFTGANGSIKASTAGGPFLSMNNSAYASQFPLLFGASGIVTGYVAQAQLGATYSVTFDLSAYAITPATVFGIWNTTEESDTYKIQVYDCASNLIAPPFPAGSFSFMGWDDDALSGNIGWYHLTLNPATGLLATAPFTTPNTDCDGAFWTNLPPNACRIVVTGNSLPDADGVVFYFAELQPCCEITCPTNITVTTCGTNAVVFYPSPVLSSNCAPDATAICNPPSGSTFPLGTNLVNCSVVDGLGGVLASCDFLVVVLQPVQPPWTIVCPEITASVNVTGCPPVMPNLSNLVTIVTNCNLACPLTVTQDIPPGTPLTAGQHVAIVTVCDCQTNCQICDVIVHAYATSGSPTITCPPNQTILTCGTNAVVHYKVGASNYTGVLTCTPPPGSVFPLGTTWVTCT
ncbi:MAG: HYR domain-containing protein, partial [Verrucomicrobia bacterium]|nr:HYR domain-containing protein [Verrucomicrobiota bacterium]